MGKLKETLFYFLAHHTKDELDHTIHIPIGKHTIYLCARCTAIYSALAIGLILFGFIFDLTRLPVLLTACIALGIGTPVIIAWGKQTLTGRDNSNKTRIITGIGGGFGLAMLIFLPSPVRELMILGIFGVVFILLYFGKIRR
ncbi:MAG: DUF2085 domain-containing protein [Candidatus Helarchaeota archaeon]